VKPTQLGYEHVSLL